MLFKFLAVRFFNIDTILNFYDTFFLKIGPKFYFCFVVAVVYFNLASALHKIGAKNNILKFSL